MSSGLTVGVDIGGTKIVVALVDGEGTVVAARRFASGFQLTPEKFVAETASRVAELKSQLSIESVNGVGVGSAGQIDPVTGVVHHSPNLGWNDAPLKVPLEQALNVPAFITNDVRAATWGEWRRGAGRGVSDLVCFFVGTGVGGGIVSGNRLITGSSGSAGELGHIVIDINGPPCRCPNRGCLEALAGGWAIALRARQAVAEDPVAGRPLLEMANGDAEAITAETVASSAHNGDPLAQRLVSETGAALGAGVTSAVNALNPSMVVLGGGVTEGLPELIDMVREDVQRRALTAAKASLEIVKGQLGSDAVIVGAALMAREHLGLDG